MILQRSLGDVIQNLKNMRENPPSLNVAVDSEIISDVNVYGSKNELNPAIDVPDIDWDISVENSQIDWDIGTVEEADDNGNGLGPYEIINASDIGSDPTVSNQELGSHADISWDISVDTPQVDVIDDDGAPTVVLETQTSLPDALSQLTKNKEERSQLLDTEYRNKILDDLYEVYNIYANLLSLLG